MKSAWPVMASARNLSSLGSRQAEMGATLSMKVAARRRLS
jgi:hypothetical protein